VKEDEWRKCFLPSEKERGEMDILVIGVGSK